MKNEMAMVTKLAKSGTQVTIIDKIESTNMVWCKIKLSSGHFIDNMLTCLDVIEPTPTNEDEKDFLFGLTFHKEV